MKKIGQRILLLLLLIAAAGWVKDIVTRPKTMQIWCVAPEYQSVVYKEIMDHGVKETAIPTPMGMTMVPRIYGGKLYFSIDQIGTLEFEAPLSDGRGGVERLAISRATITDVAPCLILTYESGKKVIVFDNMMKHFNYVCREPHE